MFMIDNNEEKLLSILILRYEMQSFRLLKKLMIVKNLLFTKYHIILIIILVVVLKFLAPLRL